MKKLLSTAIAYANAGPHIGHAFEFVLADTIARHQKESDDVFFVTGMDEHGQKIEQKAKEEGVELQPFVDSNANLFKDLDKKLSVDYDFFVRTSDKEKHYKGAEMLWKKLSEKGDIVLREYEALYCVGCEEFKMEKELSENGECPIHLRRPEMVKEKNYFFLLSRYAEEIKKKIVSNEIRIIPETRKNEIVALLERGLEDVSFSRSKEKVSWGIPVPGDNTQVMYVWCDALSNYLTAIGYGTNEFDEERAKEMTHIIGKDILRFHAAIWPGMLLSAGLPLPKQILVHGFITSGGQKMSKSLGNVISPQEVLELFEPACGELSGEALRFVLLHEIPSFEDGDLTMESIKNSYTAHLANGIGNLTSRIMKMATSYGVTLGLEGERMPQRANKFPQTYKKYLSLLDTSSAIKEVISNYSQALDEKIQREEPFKVYKVDQEKAKQIVKDLLHDLYQLQSSLSLFMPKTSTKILECIRENKMPEKPLFNRLA
jgi:methionyl-tRNA synthetase